MIRLAILICLYYPLRLAAQPLALQLTAGCAYDDTLAERKVYVFEASGEADRIVAEVVDALGLQKNFIVKSANVQNALATVEGGQGYILYSTSFLEKFKADANTRWAAYSVLAHEIGHHLNGHGFAEADPAKRKLMELEADQFSGNVLRALGATLAEAQAGIETFGLQGESALHPGKAARREAIANGWKKKDEQLRKLGANTPAEPAPDAAELRALSSGVYADVAQFEDKLKNIVRFLATGDRMFEYPEAMGQYNQFVKGYNAARDSAFAHRLAFTAGFQTQFAQNDNARLALADWYKSALDDIHDRFILPLDTEVQRLFAELEKEKISPGKARKTFRQNWSPESALYQNLQGRVGDLEKARERLAGFLKR